MPNPVPNTGGLAESRRADSRAKRDAVIEAVRHIKAHRELLPISVAQFCRVARVSKAFLYNHPDLMELVRSTNEDLPQLSARFRRLRTDQSKDVLIASMRRTIEHYRERLERLSNENRELKRENEILYGRLSTAFSPR